MDAVVVSGASTGIGRASARLLREAGLRVYAGARKDEDLTSLERDGLVPVRLDVTQPATIRELGERIEEEASTHPLKALVNNAGVAVGGPLEAIEVDEVRRQFEVNVFGLLALTQAMLPFLRSNQGRVVNVSSIGGRVAAPYMGPYTASKHAVEAMSDALRMEVRKFGVDVAVIQPGAVLTPIWDKGERSVEEIDRTLGERFRTLYGDAISSTRRVIARQRKAAIPPEKVGEAVVHAVTSRRPRARYPVGTDAKVGITLQRWLPNRAMDRVVSRMRS